MLIAGGLSLVVVGIILWNPHGAEFISFETLPYLVLASNSAHFAASTLRLYTKPGAYQSMPYVTMALPLVAVLLLSMCMFQAETWGPHLTSLYLTWSPYHYAAQAYGLAVMYCYRSGCMLNASNKKLLWWASMLPFFYNFTLGDRVGLDWLDGGGWLANPNAATALRWFELVMPAVACGAMLYLFWRIWRSEARPMPVISFLMLITNAVWWFVLPPLQAFVWATIFHGIQYLAIVIIFHVRDQIRRPDARRGDQYRMMRFFWTSNETVARLYHIVWFYGVCFLLGYGLFNCFPLAYVFAGFGPVESVLLVAAAINIHHFVVDAYIWRLKKGDTNRTIVDSGATASS